MEKAYKGIRNSLGATAEIKGDWSGEILDLSKECVLKDDKEHRKQIHAERRRQ